MEKRLSRLKPWMKLFPQDLPDINVIYQSMNNFLWEKNADNMSGKALNYYDKEITFKEVYDSILQTANALKKSGVKKGDIVSLCSVTTPEVVYLFYAFEILGVTPNMIDPRTSTEGVHEYIKEVDSKFVISLDIAYPRIKKAIEGTNVEKVLVVSPADSLPPITKILYRLTNKDKNSYDKNVLMWKEFFASGLDGKDTKIDVPYVENHPVIILHTGGTTGTPKCVRLTAKNLNALATQYGINGFKREDKFLDVMPPFIAYGFACGIHLPFSQGVESIIIPSIDPNKLGSLLLKYKPQHMAGVPLHFQTLAKDPKVKGKDLSFLITSGCGGDSMNEGAEKEVNAFFKEHNCPYPLAKGYGMTEVSSTATTCMADNNKLGSVGYPLCFTTVGIFEPGTENELGANEEGEVYIAGPNLMLDYFNNESETNKVKVKHSDGEVWIHTGDIGYMDEDGYLFLKSRIKRVIIRYDGFKVYPTIIENAISEDKDVEKCSVVGAKDKDHTIGMLPVAFVVKKSDSKISDKELHDRLKKLCVEKLPEYVLPKHIQIVDDLPYTAISKVNYRKLEETVKEI